MANIKAIEKQVSTNLKITAIDVLSNEFGKLNMPASIGLALPEEFTIPEKGSIAYAKMEYSRLLDKQGKPIIGLGIAVYLPNGEQKVISVNSLLRSHYVTEPQQDPKDATRFITRGIERIAVCDVLQEITTMNFAPVTLIEKYFAGKTVKKTGVADVFTPKYNNERELIGFEPSQKTTFGVIKATKATTETDSENGEEEKAA